MKNLDQPTCRAVYWPTPKGGRASVSAVEQEVILKLYDVIVRASYVHDGRMIYYGRNYDEVAVKACVDMYGREDFKKDFMVIPSSLESEKRDSKKL